MSALSAGAGIYDASSIQKAVLTFEKEKVKIVTEEPNYGKVEQSVGVKYEGDENQSESLMIGFNCQIFLEIIKKIEADSISIFLSEAEQPALICGHGEERIQYVLMPMRISD